VPNPVPARYTEQLVVMVEPKMDDRVRAVADVSRRSLSGVLRSIFEAGLPTVESGYPAEDLRKAATRAARQRAARRRKTRAAAGVTRRRVTTATVPRQEGDE
jgi:hypothetical protein